jgi:hypothetical protein
MPGKRSTTELHPQLNLLISDVPFILAFVKLICLGVLVIFKSTFQNTVLAVSKVLFTFILLGFRFAFCVCGFTVF